MKKFVWVLFLYCTLYAYVSSTPMCAPNTVSGVVPGCEYIVTDDETRQSCCREVVVRTCVRWEESG